MEKWKFRLLRVGEVMDMDKEMQGRYIHVFSGNRQKFSRNSKANSFYSFFPVIIIVIYRV
jgi:hypothetical protein